MISLAALTAAAFTPSADDSAINYRDLLIPSGLIGILLWSVIKRSPTKAPIMMDSLQENLEVVELGSLLIDSGSIILTDDPLLRENQSIICDNVPNGVYRVLVVRDKEVSKWAPYAITITNSNLDSGNPALMSEEDEIQDLALLVERSYVVVADAALSTLNVDDNTILRQLFGDFARFAILDDDIGNKKGIAFVPINGAGSYPVHVRRTSQQFSLQVDLDPTDEGE